jgi:putative transposase
MDSTEQYLVEPIFFVTASITGWKHLFANEACARIVFDSLDYLGHTRKLALYAFALLPSHLNLLCRPLGGGIRKVIDGFADITARRMTAILRRRGRGPLMHYLHARTGGEGCGAPIWGEVRIEDILTRGKCASLLELIHNKPLAAQWRLAAVRSEYIYSSACFYDLGREPVISIFDIRREW